MLPWIPRISYGAVAFDLSLPQRPWTPISVGVGGYEESAAGVPSVWEYRRDEQRRILIRFTEAEWPEVWAWLVYAQRGGQFGYAPDYRGASYACYLVSPRMGEDIEPRSGDFPGVWEIELVIRTVSGAVIPGRYYGGGLLIDYRPGERLSTLHASRTSSAIQRGRDGVWREVAAGVLRDDHWSRDPVTGLLTPATLLEPAATNLIPGNRQRFEGHPWVAYGGTTVTVTQGQTIPGHSPAGAATRIQTAGGTSELKYYYDLGMRPTSRAEVYSVVVHNIGAHAIQAGGTGALGRVTVEPSQTVHVRVIAAEAPPATWVQFHLAALDPSHDLDFLAWAPQVELSAYATSPILDPTASSPNPTTRAPDSLYLDLPPEIERPGTAMAIYSRYVMLHDPTVGFSSSPVAWAIGAASGAGPRLYHYQVNSTGRLSLRHDVSPTSTPNRSVSLAGPVPVPGDLVETLSLIWTDSAGLLTGRLIARVNGGPLAGADLDALAPAGAWSGPRLYVGSRGVSPGAYEYEALRVYAGRLEGSDAEMMACMRTLRMGVR